MIPQGEAKMIETHDDKKSYCRKLGHHVPFRYCRQVGDSLPCSRVLDCWFEAFAVEDYIRQNYSEQEIRDILTPPQPKINTILDIVAKLKQKDSA